MYSMLLILSTIWFIVILELFVRIHVIRWKEEKTINHTKTAIIRCLLLIPSTIGFAIYHPWQWYYSIIPAIMMQLCLFWFLFDGLYNLGRHMNWELIGTIDKDESVLDNLKRKYGIAPQIISSAIFLFIYIYKFFL